MQNVLYLQAPYNDVSYYMAGPNERFIIDEKSGDLTVRRSLLGESQDYFMVIYRLVVGVLGVFFGLLNFFLSHSMQS